MTSPLSITTISLAGQTLEGLARVTPPCLPSFLALPLFLPILPLHSPSTRETTKRNTVSSSTVAQQQRRSQKPSLRNFSIPNRGAWGTSLRVYTERYLHGVNCNRGSASCKGPRPTTLETQEKTTETESRSTLATVYTCTIPGWLIPGKILIPTNKIRAISAGAHASRELCARALQASRGI